MDTTSQSSNIEKPTNSSQELFLIRKLKAGNFIVFLIYLLIFCIFYIIFYIICSIVYYCLNIVTHGSATMYLSQGQLVYFWVIILIIARILFNICLFLTGFLLGGFLALYLIRCIIKMTVIFIVILEATPFKECESSGLFPFFDKVVDIIFSFTFFDIKLANLASASIEFCTQYINEILTGGEGGKSNNHLQEINDYLNNMSYNNIESVAQDTYNNIPAIKISSDIDSSNSAVSLEEQNCINNKYKPLPSDESTDEYLQTVMENDKIKAECRAAFPVKEKFTNYNGYIKNNYASFPIIENFTNYEKFADFSVSIPTGSINTIYDGMKRVNDVTYKYNKSIENDLYNQGNKSYNSSQGSIISSDTKVKEELEKYKKCCSKCNNKTDDVKTTDEAKKVADDKLKSANDELEIARDNYKKSPTIENKFALDEAEKKANDAKNISEKAATDATNAKNAANDDIDNANKDAKIASDNAKVAADKYKETETASAAAKQKILSATTPEEKAKALEDANLADIKAREAYADMNKTKTAADDAKKIANDKSSALKAITGDTTTDSVSSTSTVVK